MSCKYAIALLLLIALSAKELSAQEVSIVDPYHEPLDSLVDWIGSSIRSVSADEQTQRAYEYAFIAINRAKEAERYELAGTVHQHIAYWHYIQVASEDIDSILYHDRQAYEQFKLVGDKFKMAKALVYITQSLSDKSQYREVEKYLFEALELFESVADTAEVAYTLRNLSEYFSQTESYEDAIKYAEQAEGLYEMIGDPTSLGITLFGVVPDHIAEGQLEVALTKANKALELIQSVGDDMDEGAYAYALDSRALVYQKLGEYDKALADHYLAWDKVKTIVNEETEADGWKKGIGQVLFLQGKYAEAIPYLEDYQTHILKRNDSGITQDMKMKLAHSYEQVGLLDEALATYKRAWMERDTVSMTKLANVRSELQIKYETQQKDALIAAQGNELDQKSKIQYLSFGIGALLLMLITGLLYTYRKNQRKNSKLNELNKELNFKVKQNELLLKEIHHRVKNNLQIISSLLSLQNRSIEDQAVRDAILDSESRVRSMSLIHQKLYKGDDLAAVEMKSYFSTLANNLVDAYADMTDNIDVQVDMKEMELDTKYAIPLGLIANELITNSLKYAFKDVEKGAIQIRLSRHNDELVLIISDNGASSDVHDEFLAPEGFGTSLVQILTEQLRGTIVQEKEEGYATQVRFPLLQSVA